MLESNKYNLGRKYEFYVTVPAGQKRNGGTVISIRKEIPDKRLTIRHWSSTCLGKERTIYSIYLHITDLAKKKNIKDLLNQFPTPLTLMGNFNHQTPHR